MRTVSVRHNFETAHRLPHLGNAKCRNLHGHSWWATITVRSPTLRPDGTVVEFGHLKSRLRAWIDTNLDHGAMLGADDPLANALLNDSSKVFRFGAVDDAGPQELYARDLPWPTVEAVADLLSSVAASVLEEVDAPEGAYVASVLVQETHVNAAGWEA